jgi:hypothetical protein
MRTRLVFRVALVAALGIIGAVVTAVSPAAAGHDQSSEPVRAAVAWSQCESGFECATVAVPLDWDHPRGPMISLAVIRQRAPDTATRIGALFFNPGGPGDSGVVALASGQQASTP